jgi:hypothetical protein
VTLKQLVARERFRLVATMGARGAAFSLAAAALLAGLAAFWLGDARWISEPAAPAIAWVIVLVAIGVPLAWTMIRVRRAATPAKIAHAIERERALRDGSLRGALEVEGQGAFGKRAAGALGASLGAHRGALAPAMLRGALITGAGAAVSAMLALVLLGGARRNAPDGWRAMKHPVGAWTGALVPPLTIVDPPREVMRGDSLRLRILAPSRRTISFRTRATGSSWSVRSLDVSGGAASVTLGPLDADVALVASDGRVESDTVVVRVTDRPFVGDVAIRAIYPAYLDRPAETVPAGETVRVPRGTTLVIRGRASAVLDEVALLSARDTVRLAPDGHNFAGRLNASTGGKWMWIARGERGPVADVPAPLDLDVIPDSAPHAEIVDPAHDTVTLAGNELKIRASASDDHGIATVTMRSWRELASGSASPSVEQPLAAPSATEWSGEATIDASVRGLQPGDALHVTIAATDNSPWRQTTVSKELIVRMPSLTEQRELARSMGDSLAARATRAAADQKQLAQKTDEASKSRDRTSTSDGKSNGSTGSSEKSAMSYRAAEQSKALASQQQKLQEQVKSLQKDAQALAKQLQAAGALDSSLSRQLAEAQQMLAQALTPELQQQLEDVQKSTRQQSPEDARQSMEQLARAQQALKQQLERSAEMLKRAALEGSMQTLRDEAKDLAKQERATADKMQRADSGAAKDAGQLGDRSHQLANDVQQLAQRLQQEKAESGPKALQQGAQHAQQSADAMKQASPKSSDQGAKQQQQSGAQQKGDSAQQQSEQQQGAQPQQNGSRRSQAGAQPSAQQTAAAQQGAQQMEQAAQQLSDARQQQIQEWKNGLTKDLDKSIQETLQLARQQQSLADQARAGGSPSLKGDQSAVQQGVEKVSEGVQRAARQSSHVSQQSQRALGEAQQRVQEATRQTADASPNGQQETAGAMEEAAASLNDAATKLMSDRQRAANGSSASGFSEMIEKMRQLAKEQGSLNGQSASLMPGAGGQPSGEGSEQGRTLARSQRGLAQRMEDAGAGEVRAAQMAKEMREIAAQLETGRVDASLLDRQQQLFHKLLDAGLSLQKDEREDTGKREAESATNPEIAEPTNANATGRAALKYPEPTWNELRGLSAEERQSVMEYFKRINAEPDGTR